MGLLSSAADSPPVNSMSSPSPGNDSRLAADGHRGREAGVRSSGAVDLQGREDEQGFSLSPMQVCCLASPSHE